MEKENQRKEKDPIALFGPLGSPEAIEKAREVMERFLRNAPNQTQSAAVLGSLFVKRCGATIQAVTKMKTLAFARFCNWAVLEGGDITLRTASSSSTAPAVSSSVVGQPGSDQAARASELTSVLKALIGELAKLEPSAESQLPTLIGELSKFQPVSSVSSLPSTSTTSVPATISPFTQQLHHQASNGTLSAHSSQSTISFDDPLPGEKGHDDALPYSSTNELEGAIALAQTMIKSRKRMRGKIIRQMDGYAFIDCAAGEVYLQASRCRFPFIAGIVDRMVEFVLIPRHGSKSRFEAAHVILLPRQAGERANHTGETTVLTASQILMPGNVDLEGHIVDVKGKKKRGTVMPIGHPTVAIRFDYSACHFYISEASLGLPVFFNTKTNEHDSEQRVLAVELRAAPGTPSLTEEQLASIPGPEKHRRDRTGSKGDRRQQPTPVGKTMSPSQQQQQHQSSTLHLQSQSTSPSHQLYTGKPMAQPPQSQRRRSESAVIPLRHDDMSHYHSGGFQQMQHPRHQHQQHQQQQQHTSHVSHKPFRLDGLQSVTSEDDVSFQTHYLVKDLLDDCEEGEVSDFRFPLSGNPGSKVIGSGSRTSVTPSLLNASPFVSLNPGMIAPGPTLPSHGTYSPFGAPIPPQGSLLGGPFSTSSTPLPLSRPKSNSMPVSGSLGGAPISGAYNPFSSTRTTPTMPSPGYFGGLPSQ